MLHSTVDATDKRERIGDQGTVRRARAITFEHWCGFLRRLCKLTPLACCSSERIRRETSARIVNSKPEPKYSYHLKDTTLEKSI